MFLSHEKRKKLILSINIITNSKAILNNSNGFMFDLMIALTNDCAIQMNELVTIVSDNQNNEISELKLKNKDYEEFIEKLRNEIDI